MFLSGKGGGGEVLLSGINRCPKINVTAVELLLSELYGMFTSPTNLITFHESGKGNKHFRRELYKVPSLARVSPHHLRRWLIIGS